MNLTNLIWLFFLLLALTPLLQQQMLMMARARMMRLIERRRGSRVITLIHRQETSSLLGIRFARYIDIEDSERVLSAIRTTPPEMPIDLIMHTPGGLVLAAGQIAYALNAHPGRVTVFVPHYAMSGGTLIALAADEIVMDAHAALGPVDAQVGQYPAASILAALTVPNPNRDDEMLVLGDISRKALAQVRQTIFALLKDNLPEEQARSLATALSEGRWTHDYPILPEEARQLGLLVTVGLPDEVYQLMALYPQATMRRPSVEFVPVERPHAPPPPPPAGRRRGRA